MKQGTTYERVVVRRIRAAMTDQQISVADMTHLLGVGKNTIHRWFAKPQRLKIASIWRMSKILDIPVSTLVAE